MKNTLIFGLLLLASLRAFAAAPLTPAQEARVQELVQETLLNHPEILAAAAEKLDQQSAQADREQLQTALSNTRTFSSMTRTLRASGRRIPVDAGRVYRLQLPLLQEI